MEVFSPLKPKSKWANKWYHGTSSGLVHEYQMQLCCCFRSQKVHVYYAALQNSMPSELGGFRGVSAGPVFSVFGRVIVLYVWSQTWHHKTDNLFLLYFSPGFIVHSIRQHTTPVSSSDVNLFVSSFNLPWSLPASTISIAMLTNRDYLCVLWLADGPLTIV
jgi:hypothetical protein